MYHNYIWWQKKLFLFQIYLICAENDALKTFIQVVHVPAYISTIISAADAGPDEITCFPAGQHFL